MRRVVFVALFAISLITVAYATEVYTKDVMIEKANTISELSTLYASASDGRESWVITQNLRKHISDYNHNTSWSVLEDSTCNFVTAVFTSSDTQKGLWELRVDGNLIGVATADYDVQFQIFSNFRILTLLSAVDMVGTDSEPDNGG